MFRKKRCTKGLSNLKGLELANLEQAQLFIDLWCIKKDLILQISKSSPQTLVTLKGQCHEIFSFWFFHESVSPQHQSIPFRPFWIFSKIRGDIRESRCTTGINVTGGKFATGANDTGGKIAAGINDPVTLFSLALLIPVANNGNNIRLLTP